MSIADVFFANIIMTPILMPLIGALAALLIRKSFRFRAVSALLASVVALGCGVLLWLIILDKGGPVVFQVGGWPPPFGITLVADHLSVLFVVMSQIVIVMGVLYAMGCREVCTEYPAFYPLFLFLSTGLAGAFLAGDLFDLFVFVELLAISGTVLTSVSDDRYGVEAAYKYYYISQLAAVFLLLAVGALYVGFGTLNMAHLSQVIAEKPTEPMLATAVAFLAAAFMIKSATFPFHFWQPDVYMAAPTPVSAMLSSIVGKLGVYGFLRLTTLLLPAGTFALGELLVALGVTSIIFGGMSAVGTHNLKRMLAYSTMAQLGFIMVGIGWGTPIAITAVVAFTFSHSLIKSAMLMLAGYLANRSQAKSSAFEALTGIGRRFPLSGVLFFFGGLALAGVPPTSGFIGKWLFFRSGVESEMVVSLLIITGASVLTLIYTTRAFQRIWWHESAEKTPVKPAVKPSGNSLLAPALLIGLVLLLGLWAEPLVYAAQETSRWLMKPAAYIEAVMGENNAISGDEWSEERVHEGEAGHGATSH